MANGSNFKKSRAKDISITFIFLAFFVFGIIPATSAEPGVDSAIKGLNRTAGQAYLGQPVDDNIENGVITSIPLTVGRVVGAILAFVGVIFFVLMIYGGFTWMTARGNEQQVSKAKELMGAAIVGIIIILSAYAITAYLGDALTGEI